MSKSKKKEAPAEAKPEEKASEEQLAQPEAKPEEKASEEQLVAAKKEGYDELLSALGLSPEEAARRIENQKRAKSQHEKDHEKVEYDLGPDCPVLKVNGKVIPRKGIATRAQVQTYQEMIGRRRMRLLKEKIGTDYEVMRTLGGNFDGKVVRQVNDLGDEIR